MVAVRPAPLAAPLLQELRLRLSLLPIRVRFDQRLLGFLALYDSGGGRRKGNSGGSGGKLGPPPPPPCGERGSGCAAGHASGAEVDAKDTQEGSGDSSPIALPFFQLVEVAAFSLRLDYKPRALDLAALKKGSVAEARRRLSLARPSSCQRACVADEQTPALSGCWV